MARLLTLISLILLAVLVAGCGGGKGVTTTVTNTTPPSGVSRLIQPGDDLRYEITGTHFDGWHTWAATGAYTQTVLAEAVTVPASSISSDAGPYTAPTDIVGAGNFVISTLGGGSFTVALAAPANTLQDLRDAINGLGAGIQASIDNVGAVAAPDLRLTLASTTPANVGSRITAINASGLTGGAVPMFTFTQASVISSEVVLNTLLAEVKINKDDGSLYITVENGVPKSLEEKINRSERCYVTQDPDGTIWTYGGINEAGTVYWISEPTTGRYQSLVSPLGIGSGWWSTHVNQSDGATFDPSFVVSTVEQTSVPAGTFRTNRIRGTGKIAGMHGDIDMWWSPDVGGPVQFSVTTKDYVLPSLFYSARTFTLSFKLMSKSRQG